MISVIIPAFNSEATIEKCLNSVRNQDYKNLEIICINDGSEDKTLSIMNDIAKSDKRIKVIDLPHAGYGRAINEGLLVAKGEYIGIVESDDYISRNMYSSLYKLCRNFKNIDIVKGNFSYVNIDKETKEEKIYVSEERNGVTVWDKPFSLKENPELLWGHPSIWSAIYRKGFLIDEQIVMKEDNIGGWEDNLFFYSTMIKAKSIMWTNESLYYYWSDNPVSSSNKIKNPLLPLIRMNQNIDIIEENKCEDSIKIRAYARALMYIRGAVESENSDSNKAEILDKSKDLLRRLDENIFLKYFNKYDQETYYKYSSSLPTSIAKYATNKILIYNWLPFDNQWNWGGGVTVYCKNIIEEILKSNKNVEIYFLSSGFAYMANKDVTFVRKIGNIFGDRVHQFEIVNSPVPAEQRWLYKNPLVALENRNLKKVVHDFIVDYGPFDAIHFNNIEGLSLDVLDLKDDFNNTKFVFSVHNYVPLCVNGSYYMRHKHCNCNPNHTGEDCYKCTRADIRSDFSNEQYKRGLYGINPSECISAKKWIETFEMERLDEDVSVEDILKFERTAKEKINKNCDNILAVSKRVYDISKDNGLDESKMSVSYIGTKIAERQIRRAAAEPGKELNLVFLGNDINYEEKGYPFLLKALSKMPKQYAKKINIKLTVRQAEHADIYTALKNFNKVTVIQGYTHNDLPDIFYGAHLSIVPVLWEDNLPQIAIESVAFGVPVLASLAGGASELSDSDMFNFECGSEDEMLSKLMHFVDKPDDLKEYWEHHNGLVTMPMHIKELMDVYGIVAKEEPNFELSYDDLLWIIKENEYYKKQLKFSPNSHNTNLMLEDLRRKVEIYENEKKGKAVMSEIIGKAIFRNDNNGNNNIGADLFKITVDDFNYSDFYAEIQFVKLQNVGESVSDTLCISGTWHEVTEDSYVLDIHQLQWQKDNTELSKLIKVYVKDNSVHFFGIHVGVASGYYYNITTLTSRSMNDNVRYYGLCGNIIDVTRSIPDGIMEV